MLILEIALGIVLAVLILRYLPQILDLAVSVVVLSLLLGVIAGGIALVISFPQLLYLAVIFIGIAVLLVLADHANRYIQTNYERLPPWVKSSLKCVKEIKWALVLFSSLWAILASIAVFISTAWILDSVKLLDRFPSWGWNIFGIVVPIGLTWLIYRLPWPAKARSN